MAFMGTKMMIFEPESFAAESGTGGRGSYRAAKAWSDVEMAPRPALVLRCPGNLASVVRLIPMMFMDLKWA